MKIFLGVMHVPGPPRDATLSRLLERLFPWPPDAVVHVQRDSEQHGPWWTARKCWQKGIDSGADWIIVLNDDALPCHDFWERATAALSERVITEPVCFYTWDPRATNVDSSWYTTHDGLVGVGCALSREAAVDFLEWHDRVGVTDMTDDGRINLWAMAHRQPVFTTAPSLVDHQLPQQSLVGNESHEGRRAVVPPPDPSEVIDWKELPEHLGRQHVGNQWELLYKTDPKTWDIEASYLVARDGEPVSDRPRVMIATPAYAGLEVRYLGSRDEVIRDLTSRGIVVDVLTTAGDSLVTRGRHTLMHQFLLSPATHLLFWDADIEAIEADAVFAMLSTEKDVIGGAYPFRDGSGRVVANPRKTDADTHEIQVERTASGDCIPVAEVGTGFMLVSRKAIVRLCELHPELLYKSDIPDFMGEPMWALFDTALRERRYLSEDYYFCQLWRDAGGEVYVFAPATFRHWGKEGFKGCIRDAWKMHERTA